VCVGNATLDEAVTPSGRHEVAVGGDAFYAALAARRHLDDVRVLAPLGTDLPAAALDALRAAGLDLRPCPQREAVTVRNVVTYAADGSRRWDLVTGAEHFDAMSVHPADVGAAALAATGVLLSGMGLTPQLALLPWWREHSDAVRYLDLQEDYLRGNEPALRALVTASDVFLPSEVEAVALAGTADPALAATRLRALGPGVVVVKLAERGCLVATGDRDGVTAVPAAPLDARGPVDPTGAGDAFCGAFAAAHLAGAEPVEAARAAAATAALAVASPGWGGLLHAAGAPA
jgi:ribokinase